MASLCCFSVWPPSCSISARATISFWLCEPCWPGVCLVVSDPLCPHCLQLVRPLRSYPLSGSNWCLGSCWSKVPSWLWSPGNFPSSEALQSLPTCLSMSLSACLAAPTLSVDMEGKAWRLSLLLILVFSYDMTVVGCPYLAFSKKKPRLTSLLNSLSAETCTAQFLKIN